MGGKDGPLPVRASARASAALPLLGVLAFLTAPAPGFAATTSPVAGGVPTGCAPNTSYVMDIFDPILGYEVGFAGSEPGVITQWKFLAGTGVGTVALQILSEQLRGELYTPVAESAIVTPTASTLNTFPTHLPLPAGEFTLGLRAASGSPDCLYSGFPPAFNGTVQASPAPALGSGPTTYGAPQSGVRLNVGVVRESDADGDGFGDETEDGCPGSAARHDDCVKPTVTLEKGKPRKRKATFVFSSNEAGGSFECHLEKKKFSPCASPLKLKNLKPGRHTFTVRAVDANNNRSSQTSFWWRVK